MVLKKCNEEVDLPNNINFDTIKDIKVFSKVGSLATDISREVFKELFIQVKKIEKEKERKGELENGREVNTSNAQGNSRGQNEDRNNANGLGDRILRGRGNGTMVSNIRAGGGSGNRAEPSTLWNDVERIPTREQTPRDNNISNDWGTEQENVRNTGNGRELQGENSETTTRGTTNATVRQDVGESITSNTNTSDSRGNDNQGYSRESSINSREETQESNKDLGSFSIEEKSIEEIKTEDMISYINENIGKEIDFENDKYLIYTYSSIFNKVRLSLASASYPIFRDESVETIYYALKNQFEEQVEENNIKENEVEKEEIKNTINNIEETQEPSENIGSFSIEKNPIEDIEEVSQEDMGNYIKANIGTILDYDGDKYIVYGYNDFFKKVEITLENSVYPIFRDESVETIYYALKNQLEQQIEKNNIKENEIKIENYDEVDEDSFILFNEALLNFIRKENIDGRNILHLIDSLDKDINNEEKGYYIKDFFKDLDFSYYDESLGLNIEVQASENGLKFINIDIGVKFTYEYLQ